MNREIKFRAWDKDSKVMINWKDLQDYFSDQTTFIDLEKLFLFLQYTGLKDKNGKEIYVGDIIELGLSDIKYKVYFKKGVFGINSLKCGFIPLSEYKYYKVIGNIYKNKELVE